MSFQSEIQVFKWVENETLKNIGVKEQPHGNTGVHRGERTQGAAEATESQESGVKAINQETTEFAWESTTDHHHYRYSISILNSSLLRTTQSRESAIVLSIT